MRGLCTLLFILLPMTFTQEFSGVIKEMIRRRWHYFDVLYWLVKISVAYLCPSYQDTSSLTKTCSAELLKDNKGCWSHWRHWLTYHLSSLNCLVTVAQQQMIKTQRWPTKVPLYPAVSKTTSLPSLAFPFSPPVSTTEWKSGKDSFCRASQSQHRRGPDHTAGRWNSPLTKNGAHDSFITSLTGFQSVNSLSLKW